MKLITVEAAVSADERDAAVALFDGQADAVRGMNGCEHDRIFRSDDGTSVAIVQHWTTMEAFDAYRGSETFATLGQGLKPMMTAPPSTTVATVD